MTVYRAGQARLLPRHNKGLLLYVTPFWFRRSLEIPVQQTAEDIGTRNTDSYGCRRRRVNSPDGGGRRRAAVSRPFTPGGLGGKVWMCCTTASWALPTAQPELSPQSLPACLSLFLPVSNRQLKRRIQILSCCLSACLVVHKLLQAQLCLFR